MATPKAGRKTRTRHRTAPRTVQGPNYRQLRMVAIDLFGNCYTKNQIRFKIEDFMIPKQKIHCEKENQIGRYTTAVGGGWYNA